MFAGDRDKDVFERTHEAIERNMGRERTTNKDIENTSERHQLDRLDEEKEEGTTP